jgi:glycosyltransferase involved in cell wall biosynthesis
MKILHSTSPARVGGLEEVVIRLASGLRGRGHDVAVAAVFSGDPGTHPFLDALGAEGVTVHPIVVPPRGYRQEVKALRGLLDSLRPDVLHTHGYRPDVLHAGSARRLGIPAVTTLHGFTGGGWKNRVYERLQLRSVRRSDAVIAVSRPMAERLSAEGVPEGRVHILPNAWSARGEVMEGAEARERLGIPQAAFHVGWVGRLSHEKGADVLVEALRQDALGDLAGLPEIAVSVIGDGPQRAELERAGLEHPGVEKVRFHGAVPDAGKLFRAFDLLVLSSRSEGTPIVLFEAMSAGIPIVATTVGGVPDVLGKDDAILVPPEDPVALAKAIRSVMGDPAGARARALHALERVEKDFSPGPWLDRHEALYGSLLR